jgi:cytochrome c peroxidase
MQTVLRASMALMSLLILVFIGCGTPGQEQQGSSGFTLSPKEQLGRLLFNDVNLSAPPGQACSECHSLDAGFGRPPSDLPVSRGANRDRFGNRNDLIAAYASFIPPLRYDSTEGVFRGGLFWDGRAATLEDQAKGPPLNPLEMANPDAESLVERIRTASYASLFREVFGQDALDEGKRAFNLMAEAIAAYERSPELNRFDSKYDFYLKGKVKLTEQEMSGLQVFEDPKKGNCASCHPSQPSSEETPPLFTDYTYDNLGVPKNAEVPFYYMDKKFNPAGVGFVDLGLGGVVRKKEQNGKFRVPTLRNIAITSPYMHNGVFKSLRQVVMFYSTRDIGPWPPPEVRENVNTKELGKLRLSDQEIDDLVAFMKTLTDGYRLE